MRFNAVCKWAGAGALALAVMASPVRMVAQDSGTVLKPADTQKLLPASLYYKGQSATTQFRNSGGVKFADGFYVLATLVDTSGYSSDVSAKYQAYFITEIPIKIGGETLPAGVYGVGFIAGGKFVVTDVGAHDLLTENSKTDEGLKRPHAVPGAGRPGRRLPALRRPQVRAVQPLRAHSACAWFAMKCWRWHEAAARSAPGSCYAAFFIRIVTRNPAAAAILTKTSRPKRSILPWTRFEMRGWVTPKTLAACA